MLAIEKFHAGEAALDVTQLKKWLAGLRAAGSDPRRAAFVAQDIQRRLRPGKLHLAASECRMACVSAESRWARAQREMATRNAIRALEHALEQLVSVAAEK
jgi:hypothetical protein